VTLSFQSFSRMQWLLIAAVLLMPAMLFAGAAWKSRSDALREGEATTLNAVAVLGDSVRSHLRTEELILASVADHLKAFDWADIARPGTSDYLAKLPDYSFDKITAIWVADDAGTIRAASQVSKLGNRIAEEQVLKIDGHEDSYVSSTFTAGSRQLVALVVLRRRVAPDGRLDGTIGAEIAPGVLARLFAEATPVSHDSLLIAADGKVLASDASRQGGPPQIAADDPLMRQIALRPPRGFFSAPSATDHQTEQLSSYEQVPGYPVWVVVGIDRTAILQRWYGSLEVYGAAATIVSMALLLVSCQTIRRARTEQAALILLHTEVERRLKAERRLRAAHRLEAVGQLAAGVAHDFNNLLLVISGSLELVGRATDANDRVQVLLDRSRRAVDRGGRLASSLLAFSQRQMLQTTALDVNLLITEFLPAIQLGVGDLIRLELRLDPTLSACRADAAQLEAALLNVAINARDAMEGGGTLIIATQCAKLDRDQLADNSEAMPGTFVAVSLADSGSGMSQEVVDKAFEPFFTTKEIGKGAGLGLSQVLGLVRQLGGHVTIESKPGSGTIVTLFLPRA
jgi:two-component system NtrC family sensor kinase